MDDATVKVGPSGEGWVVDAGIGLQPLMFLSGAKAEAQAHALARSLASAGSDARVAVHDRAQQLVGAYRYFAEDDLPGPAAGSRRRTEA
jgi:hypothetical protein